MARTTRITNYEIPSTIARRVDFLTGNETVKAEKDPGHIIHGRLPAEWRDLLRTLEVKFPLQYVVYSYATPIAWVDARGRVYIPDVKYSPTTTRHQTLAALGFYGADVTTSVPATL